MQYNEEEDVDDAEDEVEDGDGDNDDGEDDVEDGEEKEVTEHEITAFPHFFAASHH